MRPKIAVTARALMNGTNRAYFSNEQYIKAIIAAKGNPILITPNLPQNLDVLIEQCDGLLVTGGSDANPNLYKQNNHEKTSGIDDEIDALDFLLIQECFKYHKPIFGICRGLQMINIAFGGTLIQDIPSQYSQMREGGHMQTKPGNQVEHLVYFTPDTYAHQVFGDAYGVNSFHHQAIFHLGKQLRVSGVSEDGIIEAIEGDKLFAVQWHPERLLDDEKQMRLFQDFISMCKNNSGFI